MKRYRALAMRALILMGAVCALHAQTTSSGSLTGKLTDVRSHPLGGALVILRDTASGAEFRTITQSNGTYHLTGLAAGEYVLVAERSGQGRGSVGGIFVSGGHEARVQTALELSPANSEVGARPSNTASIAVAQPAVVTMPVSPSPAEVSRPPQANATPHLPALQPTGTEAAVLAGDVRAIRAAVPAAIAGGSAVVHPGSAPGLVLTLVGISEATAELKVASAQALMSAELKQDASVDEADAMITGEQLGDLPGAGRDWASFTMSSTAVDQASRAQVEDSPVVALPGMRSATLDGIGTGMAFGEPAGLGQDGLRGGVTSSDIGIATIRSSGMDDDLATGVAGRSVKVETRQGGEGIHGQAAVFDRQNLWGARNPFSQWVQMTAPSTATTVPAFTAMPYTAPDRALTWEAGVGGAYLRRRLFWFTAVDGRERNDPGVAAVKHPENFFAQPASDEMQVLSARLGLGSSDPVAEGIGAYSAMLTNLSGLLGPAARTATQLSGFARIDWQTAERHRFTLEGSATDWDSPGGGLTRVSEPYGSHSFGSSRAGELQMTGRWDAFITANLMLESEGSIERHILIESPNKPSAFEGGLDANVWGQLPQMVVDSRYGFTIGNPARFAEGSYPDEHQYEGHGRIAWVRNKLLINAGVDVEHDADATSLLKNRFGTYVYSNVENFISDALSFTKYGLSDALDPMQQHNCDERGEAWRDGSNQLHGLGYLPCYAYYSQTLGPTDWHLSTNEWAGYATAQWEPGRRLVASAALRWEREQLPPPIGLLDNPELPLTERLPRLGNEWSPRFSLAWGSHEVRWPVLRLGYGLYFARTQNSVTEAALTHTGSMKGDLNLFMRPTDNLAAGGAPPFPYVLAGEPGTVVKPSAVEFSPSFSNPEAHQAEVSIEQDLPGGIRMEASGMASLGRRLPVTMDENLNLAGNPGTITYSVADVSGKGPLKGPGVTVPFYASWPAYDGYPGATGRINPDYQEISQITSRANSTYEAASLRMWHNAQHGLSLNARYTYSHAMDWNPNETAQVFGSSLLDPTDFRLEYGTSDLDVRHASFVTVAWQTPWKLNDRKGWLWNGWKMAAAGHLQSGLPYTMRTAGAIPKEFMPNGATIIGVGTGMNGSGGDNRVYGVGRNTYRYPLTWKADLRLGKKFDLGHMREVETYIDTFNLFNHQNVTRLENVGYYMTPAGESGSLPTLNFLTGLKTGQTEFGTPLDVNATNFFRPRQVDFGMRMRF